jgi:hypothetical protein
VGNPRWRAVVRRRGSGMDVVDPAGRLRALALLAGPGELYVDAWPDDDPAQLQLRRAKSNC